MAPRGTFAETKLITLSAAERRYLLKIGDLHTKKLQREHLAKGAEWRADKRLLELGLIEGVNISLTKRKLGGRVLTSFGRCMSLECIMLRAVKGRVQFTVVGKSVLGSRA